MQRFGKRETNKVKKRKHRVLKAVGIFFGLLVVFVGGLLFLMTRKPKVYQPSGAAVTGVVNPYITHYLAPEIYNNVQVDKPFCIIVRQKDINEIVVDGSLDWEWPIDLGAAVISAPAVTFLKDEILLMGTVEVGVLEFVITIGVKPVIDDEGLMHLNFEKVKAGLVDVTFMARSITCKILADELAGVEIGHETAWMKDMYDAVAENKPFEPVWPVYEDAIKLTKVDIVDGQLTLVFVPGKVNEGGPVTKR